MVARTILLMWLLAWSWMAAGVELIGKTMPPYPEGLQDVGGICVTDPGGQGRVCDFSIGFVGDAGADPALEPLRVAARLSAALAEDQLQMPDRLDQPLRVVLLQPMRMAARQTFKRVGFLEKRV